MPNWCRNKVTLNNPNRSSVDALERELKRPKPTPFNFIYPRPSWEDENWYDWNISRWGTKWDVDPYEIHRIDSNTIAFEFESAWSPPIEIYKFLAQQGWGVVALFSEPGCLFCGQFSDAQALFFPMPTNYADLIPFPTELAEFLEQDIERYFFDDSEFAEEVDGGENASVGSSISEFVVDADTELEASNPTSESVRRSMHPAQRCH